MQLSISVWCFLLQQNGSKPTHLAYLYHISSLMRQTVTQVVQWWWWLVVQCPASANHMYVHGVC